MFRRLLSIPTVLVLLLCAASTAQGQQRTAAARDAALDAAMAEMSQRLDLTESQAEEIRRILVSQNEKSRALLEEARASGRGRAAMGAMREEMRAIRAESDEQIVAILTEDQAAEFLGMREERAERRPRGPSSRP